MNYEVFIIFNSNIKFRKIDNRIVNNKIKLFMKTSISFNIIYIECTEC